MNINIQHIHHNSTIFACQSSVHNVKQCIFKSYNFEKFCKSLSLDGNSARSCNATREKSLHRDFHNIKKKSWVSIDI